MNKRPHDLTTGTGPRPGTGYTLEDQIGFLLRRANQRHLGIFNSHMGNELTAQQFAVLAKMHEVGETSQNELGRQTAMDQSTINGVIQRLMKRGLVDKCKSETDRRMLILRLTDAGEALFLSILPEAFEITEETFAPLGERDRKTLVRLLRQIL